MLWVWSPLTLCTRVHYHCSHAGVTGAFSAAKEVQGRLLLLKIARVLLLLLSVKIVVSSSLDFPGEMGAVARFACGLEPGKAPWLENRTGSLLRFQLFTVGTGVASG